MKEECKRRTQMADVRPATTRRGGAISLRSEVENCRDESRNADGRLAYGASSRPVHPPDRGDIRSSEASR